MKRFIRSLIPPILFTAIQKYRNRKYGWKGDYSTWQQAKRASTGYEKDNILRAVENAVSQVKSGKAVYERDSVIFDEIQYSWPLLTGIMLASVKTGSVKVLDFGGSLGSTYYQNKKFLDIIDSVSWSIVEQKHFVEIGKKKFEDERLKFYYSVEECLKKEQPNVLLLSSVLQYLEKPYEILDLLLQYDFSFILLGLTAVSTEKEKLTVQYVHPSVYEARYPCWLLDYNKIQHIFEKNNYQVIEKFNDLNDFQIVEQGRVIGRYIGEIRKK